MKPSIFRIVGPLFLVPIITSFAADAAEYAVFKSKDHGRSWVRSDGGLPDESRVNAFGASDARLFAGTDSGIYVSTDEAHSWQPAMGVAMTSGRIISFATLGRKVFAGTDGSGILESSDTGKTWTRNAAFSPKKVRSLVADGTQLYAGTDTDGVFASSDDGQTWLSLQHGFPAQGQVFALAVVNGRLFAGLYSSGLYAWDELEQRWSKVGPVSPLVLAGSGDTLVVGHNPGGIYWSGDLGASWSKGRAASTRRPSPAILGNSGELSADAPVWEMASSDELVLAGASNGIFYSEDRGHTWTRARTGLPDESPGVSFLVKHDFVMVGTSID